MIVGGDYDWSWGTGSGQAGSGGTCGLGRDQAVEPDSSSSSTPYHPFLLGPSRVARWTSRSSTAHRERDGSARASSETADCVPGVSTTPRPNSPQAYPHWTRLGEDEAVVAAAFAASHVHAACRARFEGRRGPLRAHDPNASPARRRDSER